MWFCAKSSILCFMILSIFITKFTVNGQPKLENSCNDDRDCIHFYKCVNNVCQFNDGDGEEDTKTEISECDERRPCEGIEVCNDGICEECDERRPCEGIEVCNDGICEACEKCDDLYGKCLDKGLDTNDCTAKGKKCLDTC